ncbi:MAG: hypothetical protein ACLFTB_06545 [Desulfovibrionales bacterium]
MVEIHLEPDEKTVQFDRLNTVLQLLNKLNLRPTSALIIRDGELLTPDQRIHSGDRITVRQVTSRG